MTARFESIMQDIVAKITTQLQTSCGVNCIATTNITEDMQKLTSAQTPRVYVFRDTAQLEDEGSNIPLVMQAKIVCVVYVRQEKDATTTTQTLLNTAEEAILTALISNNSGTAISHYIDADNISYTIIFHGSETPIYGGSEAFMDMNFLIRYRR